MSTKTKIGINECMPLLFQLGSSLNIPSTTIIHTPTIEIPEIQTLISPYTPTIESHTSGGYTTYVITETPKQQTKIQEPDPVLEHFIEKKVAKKSKKRSVQEEWKRRYREVYG